MKDEKRRSCFILHPSSFILPKRWGDLNGDGLTNRVSLRQRLAIPVQLEIGQLPPQQAEVPDVVAGPFEIEAEEIASVRAEGNVHHGVVAGRVEASDCGSVHDAHEANLSQRFGDGQAMTIRAEREGDADAV